MGWLLVCNGSGQQLRLRPGTVQIGRAQTAHIKAVHQSVSRVHAEIVVEPCTGALTAVSPLGVKLVDRSSTGHTFVDGSVCAAKVGRLRRGNGPMPRLTFAHHAPEPLL